MQPFSSYRPCTILIVSFLLVSVMPTEVHAQNDADIIDGLEFIIRIQ